VAGLLLAVVVALNAASRIGDDTLQRESSERVRRDSFTHGTAAQRQQWFATGFRSAAT
jgi:predicted metalloprotease